ncbi:MAG: TIGR01777 family protein [Gemmatimonadales bacterium]|nr:TIGR01777 family protein [Gemmatimonadales bacterium]
MPSGSMVERSSRLPFSAESVFAWHERPGAFERLTPPWERAEVLQRTGGLEDGGRVVMRVGAPVGFRWVARHLDYKRDRQFADEQVEGPFARWRHLHQFEADGPGACVMTDRIEYALPFGAAGAAGEPLLIRPRLERMLGYRHELLRRDLEAHAQYADRPRLRIAVTGASGLIGRALVSFLTSGGHTVVPLVRQRARANEAGWNYERGWVERDKLEGLDAVVHLAGENVGARWTPERRRRIRESRAIGTRFLAETLAWLDRPPRVLISASAVGIYGNRGDETLTETSPTSDAPSDFLTAVGRDWEAATEPARAAGIRTVLTRFGIVLTPAGGALGRMLPPFRLGLGGPLGNGRQYMSWIAIDDLVGAVHHALMTDSLSGAVNLTAPHPATAGQLATTLGRVLGRPAAIPVPAPALRLAFGEMADVALLSSARVLPARLQETGYAFRYPTLEAALRFLLGRPAPAT